MEDRVVIRRGVDLDWWWLRLAGDGGKTLAQCPYGFEDVKGCLDAALMVNAEPYVLEVRGDVAVAQIDTSGEVSVVAEPAL